MSPNFKISRITENKRTKLVNKVKIKDVIDVKIAKDSSLNIDKLNEVLKNGTN